MTDLFPIPACAQAVTDLAETIPAGGFGGGHFTFAPTGEFRRWRLHPSVSEQDVPVPFDRFHVWTRQGRQTAAHTLQTLEPQRRFYNQRTLFPFTWTDYTSGGQWSVVSGQQEEGESGRAGEREMTHDSRLTTHDSPLRLASLAFSPLLPGSLPETSLPLYVIVFRAQNPTDEPMEAALMLTWACGWPDLVPNAVFDFQHDKLCLTGALGALDSPFRQEIALPDLHSESIYLQGIEPWGVPHDEAEVWEDFAEDGELDPRIVRAGAQGAAAWVKFDLDPGETKEIPFILAWHFPVYESGPFAGQARHYTGYLGKHRPDNAIVWLAEQAVENFGAETANYRYWMQQIEDWQRRVLEDGALSEEAKRQRFNGLTALLDVDTVWTEEGDFRVLLREGQTQEALHTRLASALLPGSLWPELAAYFPGRER